MLRQSQPSAGDPARAKNGVPRIRKNKVPVPIESPGPFLQPLKIVMCVTLFIDGHFKPVLASSIGRNRYWVQ